MIIKNIHMNVSISNSLFHYFSNQKIPREINITTGYEYVERQKNIHINDR